MATLAIIAMIIFIVLLSFMTFKAGVQPSISALVQHYKWLLLIALWSQALLLPYMLDITPDLLKVLVFLGMGGIVGCGITDIKDKSDEVLHMVFAIIAFISLFSWVILMDLVALIPFIVCAGLGKDNIKWRAEIGLISSVYLIILQSL